jgi:CxxC-x17-CxxC domain-containing protein
MSDINFFAKTNFRNQERIFGIKEDMYVVGKTGMGKSNLLENMAIQDIQNDKGVCVIDPHGEFADKMLKAVPSHRVNDVIYFNPADVEYPIAFNILEAVEEDKKHLIASGMMGVFKKIWPDVWSARMEYILNNTILALLDYPGSTMLGVSRMMSDSDFRKRVYPAIKDPVVKGFWINEFDKWDDKFRKEAVAAIQNKVGQFLSSSVIRHVVGQAKSSIDLRDIMDNQKILIVNLSKGRIGEDSMRLLGGMLITKMQLAVMGRVDIPEEERKDFYLYVDEFQNFANESFAGILSEARKYRLNLTLTHQYINQLIFDNNTGMRDAIFGNVGTIVTFRVGAEDAEFLEKEFDPVFLLNDIVNLSKYNIYLKLMIDGIAGDAFSAVTLPPFDLSETAGNAEKVIRISRERYGKNRAEIEEKISRWSGVMIDKNLPIREVKSQLAPKVVVVSKNSPSNIPPKKIAERVVEKPARLPASMSEALRAGNASSASNASRSDADWHSDAGGEETAKIAEERPMYEAICSTCEQKIQVPFKPDPKRPTFCKECLKDYQRMVARSRNDNPPIVAGPVKNNFKEAENKIVSRETEPVTFVAKERPLSLSQISHMASKKFKPIRQKPQVDLAEVRRLINDK